MAASMDVARKWIVVSLFTADAAWACRRNQDSSTAMTHATGALTTAVHGLADDITIVTSGTAASSCDKRQVKSVVPGSDRKDRDSLP